MRSAAMLWTGGKDSSLALFEAAQSGYSVSCLVTFAPPVADFLAHPLPFIKLQAEALALPHHVLAIDEPFADAYEAQLRKLRDEMNIDTVQKLNAERTPAIYGDATHREILRSAKLEEAVGLVISSSTSETGAIIKAARELNPKVRILTRAVYLAESEELRKAGADAIFSSEGEVALSMTDYLMEQLGATDEQIDRERDRVRKDLFSSS